MTLMGVNPRYWQRPREYLPERFDPDSPLYNTPDGKPRHPFTMIQFGFGPRNCPGQVLAWLETKIMVAYVMLKLQFELDLDPELKGKEGLSFAFPARNRLHIKIKKVNP